MQVSNSKNGNHGESVATANPPDEAVDSTTPEIDFDLASFDDYEDFDDPRDFLAIPVMEAADADDGAINTPVTIRSFEGGGFFRTHNALLHHKIGAGRAIKAHGIAIYSVLSKRANNQTQQAIVSYKTMTLETGMSRTKAIETVRDLEAKRFISRHARYDESGRRSNVYTLLDPCHWRYETTFAKAKGRSITNRPTHGDDAEDDAPAAGNPQRNPTSQHKGVILSPPRTQGNPGGSSDEPDSMPSASVLVHPADCGGAQCDHIQDSHTKTSFRQDSLTKTHPKTIVEIHAEPFGGRFLPPLPGGGLQISGGSDPTSHASKEGTDADRPLTQLEQTILQLSSSRNLTDPMRESLNFPVTCVRNTDAKEYPGPEAMYEKHTELFQRYVHDCAERFRREFRKKPPANLLIRGIRAYDRYQTGWLDFSKGKGVVNDKKYYHVDGVPAWMQ